MVEDIIEGGHWMYWKHIDFGNEIGGVYQTEGRSLHSKDSKQTPSQLRVGDRHLIENNIYQRIAIIMKSQRRSHSEAEAIDVAITQSHKQQTTVKTMQKTTDGFLGL